MHNDLKSELLKQFPAEATEMQISTGDIIYACPKCRRAVTLNADKCTTCGQTLTWNNIFKKSEATNGTMARIDFDIPPDFTKGDCRKCPLSHIVKKDSVIMYDCPLKMKTNCRLEII